MHMSPHTLIPSSPAPQLVLINITDHYNRTRANESTQQSTQQQASTSTKVWGVLLGIQTGRVVDISNSFELAYTLADDHSPIIDNEFYQLKATQYKQVFKDLEIVGWYATGPITGSPSPHELVFHRLLSEVNEAPVLLMLDPTINHTRRDLPVALYETEMGGGEQQVQWVSAVYGLETSEAERIGVDQVAKIVPAGRADASNQCTLGVGLGGGVLGRLAHTFTCGVRKSLL